MHEYLHPDDMVFCDVCKGDVNREDVVGEAVGANICPDCLAKGNIYCGGRGEMVELPTVKTSPHHLGNFCCKEEVLTPGPWWFAIPRDGVCPYSLRCAQKVVQGIRRPVAPAQMNPDMPAAEVLDEVGGRR